MDGFPIEGEQIHYTLHTPSGQTCTFHNYYLQAETYEKALTNAGFVDFEWVPMQLEPINEWEPKYRTSDNFWTEFLEHPPLIFFRARYSGSHH